MSIASLYPSINPSLLLDFANVKRLDPRITFTRTTTATYYDGVTTAKAEENLLTYSQAFDNAAWSTTASTVTANSTTAPDGTSTADTLTETATTNYHSIYQINISLAATSYTFSCFAKPNGRNEITLVMLSGSDTAYATYNVSTGSITVAATTSGSFSSASTTITASANGFYRVTLTATAPSTSTATLAIELYNAARTYAGNGTSGVYLWGAQLEQRSSATAYTATTTQAITNYIPVLQTASAGQARFDHNPTTGESLGLLIEEARTNLAQYSGDFSNAYWTKSNATTTGNTIVSPAGSISGAMFNATSAGSYVYGTFSLSATTYTASFYAKAGSATSVQLDFVTSGFGLGASCTFDLSAGTAGAITHYGSSSGFTAAIQSVGNGWYRCSITGTATATTWFFELGIINNSGKFIYIWGGQLEAGSFATSYIPTVASSVTRNADAASMTGTNFSSWFNNGEGTVYFEAQPMYVGTATSSLNSWLWDGTTNNFIGIGQNNSYGNGVGIDGIVRVNGSNTVYGSTTTGVTTSSAFKVTMAYEVDNTGSYLNGASFIADTSCTIPVVNQWKFSGNYVSGNTSNGWVRKLSYYPQRLSATNLAALTT